MRENTRFGLITGFLAVLALLVSICAHLTYRFPGDLQVTLYLQSFDNHFLLSIMEGVSFIFGGWRSALMVIITGIIVWWQLGRVEAIMIPVGGLLTLINEVLKPIINRPRPSGDLVHILSHELDNGFPSGHALFAIVILGLVAYFTFNNLKNQGIRVVVIVGLIFLILLVGVSRVYLGVHWLSDVVGGYFMGGVILTALIWFHQSWKRRHLLKHEQVRNMHNRLQAQDTV